MTTEERITRINAALKQYFKVNKDLDKIQAKALMSYFIEKGIFNKDYQEGLPIRKVLRKLDRTKQLNKIPMAHAERKKVNTNWYFINPN